MPYLNKQQILEAQDRKYEDVEIPEWGGMVRIGTMSAAARDQYEVRFVEARKTGADANMSLRALLVAACVVDESGEPVFTMDDVVALGKKSGAALNRVFSRALDLNVLTKVAAERVAGE